MSKTVITDYTFSELDVETAILEAAGTTVTGAQCRTPDELIRLVHDADYVITQFAPVNADVVNSMQRAQVIVRYGIGVDNVDLETARAKDIPVCNVPDYCTDEVADHALALILAATRKVVPNDRVVSQGEWRAAGPPETMFALSRLTVGVVGFGRIGHEVVQRLIGFKAAVLVHDPAVDDARITATGARPAALDELLQDSDLITLHCPANDHTHHMINAASLSTMKDGVILVNVSRGPLVSTADLISALESRRVAYAALDVAEVEPMEADNPLRQMDNVLVHSHIASASGQAIRQLRESVAQTVVCAIRGEPLPNVVSAVS